MPFALVDLTPQEMFMVPVVAALFGAFYGTLRYALMRPLYNAIRDNIFTGGIQEDHPIYDRYADDLKNYPIKTNLFLGLFGLNFTSFIGGPLYKYIFRPIYNDIRGGEQKAPQPS